MNTPDPTTLFPEALTRVRAMREQEPLQPMPPLIEFYSEWGHGLEAIAMCHNVDRDDALNLVYIGTTGFSCDRVVLCMDTFVSTPEMHRKDALTVMETDRDPDGGVIFKQVILPYTVDADAQFTWHDPMELPSDAILDGTVVECFRDSFARPKTLDADIDGTFMEDIAKELFGVSREESRIYLRAATAAILTQLGICEIMVAATSDEDRDKIAAFMDRTAGIGGISID